MLDDPRLIPHTRLARLLGVAPQWLAGELAALRLPGVQAGDRWLCDPAAVEAALFARARKSPARRRGAR